MVKRGTGTRHARWVARPRGKTGTATNDGGTWSPPGSSGYTPQVATAVMYVRGNGRKALEGYLPPFYGATYPARTWTAMMKR